MSKDITKCIEKQLKSTRQRQEKQCTTSPKLAKLIIKQPALLSLIKAFDLVTDERV